MNPHILFGIICFSLWSTFSTWYYVNYIKNFDEQVIAEVAIPIPPTKPSIPEADSTQAIQKPVEEAAIKITRNFLFEKNTAKLVSPKNISAFLDSIKPKIENQQVFWMVVGHTCDLGSESHNQTLSEIRARTVSQILQKELNLVEIKVDFKGEQNPRLPNISEENRKKNRRVTLLINSQL